MYPKKNTHFRNDLITIPAKKINVQKIVDNIKSSIKKKKIKYIQDLESRLPNVINTTENGEFLLDGWYENEIIAGQKARWTKKEFSFLFNPGEENIINLKIVATPPDIEKRPLRISLYINREKIDEKIINKRDSQILSFTLPKKFRNKNIQPKFKLSYTFTPAEYGSGDVRKLGIAIKEISNLPLTKIGSYYLPKLLDFQSYAPLELEKIKYHSNPINLFPQKTRLKWVKKLILRLIRVYTSAQIAFNVYTHEFLKNIVEHLRVITSYLQKLDSKITQIEKNLQFLKERAYEPLFWKNHEDSFYVFQQEKFRGNFELVKQKQRKYLKYIQELPQELKEKYAFLDIGFGRGEFLELLKENNISKIVGVDINPKYVEKAKKKGFKVYCQDAISFLYDTQEKFAGVSAFHLVEHLTFPQLFDLLYLIHQKLVSGGILILETPNTENLTVGANSFFYDHTHKTKLPPLFLKTLLEYLSFKNIQIIYSSPIKKKLDNDLERLVFGPQDYAIIAYK